MIVASRGRGRVEVGAEALQSYSQKAVPVKRNFKKPGSFETTVGKTLEAWLEEVRADLARG